MKRSNNFGNNVGKKFKTNPALEDDLWGDDPDVDDLDDCIFRATQVCENVENETNFEAKEGEVSILRIQLKHTKETLEAESVKKQKEFKDQLQLTMREKEEAVTMLDMKNLEIANLKRKLLDVSKSAVKEMMSQSIAKNHIVNSTQINVKPKKNSDLKIDSSLHQKIYPLKRVINSMIFKIIPEERLDLVNSFNDTRHLSVAIPMEDNREKIGVKTRTIKMEDLYPDIEVLLNSDEWELKSSDESNKSIGKIGVATLQLLDDILVYLETLKVRTKEDCIRRYDLEYLSNTEHATITDLSFFNPEPWCPGEKGIHCRQLLGLLAEVIPHNNYSQHFIMDKYGLKDHAIMYDYFKSFRNTHTFIFLQEILETVKLIGEMRKSYEFCGFLSAVCHLLTNIFKLQDNFNNETELDQYFQNITREVIFSRPCPVVLHRVMLLLSNVSNDTFIETLCNFPRQNALVKKNKKDIYLTNNDCCTFQVFSILYKECIWRYGGLDIEKCITALQFICNVFNVNAKWLYFHNSHYSSHSCLCEIYILAVEVVSIVVRLTDTGQIMKNALELSVKTMQLINFKYYDLLERKTDHYLHFKRNIMNLMEKCSKFKLCNHDVTAMEKILTSITEESQSSEELENIHKNRLFQNL